MEPFVDGDHGGHGGHGGHDGHDDGLLGALRSIGVAERCVGILNPLARAEEGPAAGTLIFGRYLDEAFAAKLAFGQMGEELLLGGQRVKPAKLEQTGYAFQYPELEAALRHVLA